MCHVIFNQTQLATPKFSFLLKFSSVVSGVFAHPGEYLETFMELEIF